MSSAVSGLGSFDPTTLINSLIAPTASTAATAQTNGVSAQQEFSAMEKNGDLNALLSDSVAVGVMQMADAPLTPTSAATDIPTMVNQLIAAYTPNESASSSSGTSQESAATLSTNPALAIIQAMEETGSLGSTLSDSVASGVLSQAATG